MRHRSHYSGMDRRRDEHATLLDSFDRATTVGADVDLHEVRLDLFQVDVDTGRRKPRAEPSCAGVVVRAVTHLDITDDDIETAIAAMTAALTRTEEPAAR